MEVSSATSSSPAALQQLIDIALAQQQMNAVRNEGAAIIQLLQSAVEVVQQQDQGGTLNTYA